LIGFGQGNTVKIVGRPKGSGNNELRKIINESIDPNKISETLNKIEDPIDYINAITKLLPYAIGKKKMVEDVQEIEPISVNINFLDTK
tara:strand:+ start:1013 stop:1276 length:264 start_codon:yes stop_codon:yes gene_type:complete